MAGSVKSRLVRRFFVKCNISGNGVAAEFTLTEQGRMKLYDDEQQVRSYVRYLNFHFNHPASPYTFNYTNVPVVLNDSRKKV